jgi:SAM-dependent methyltransferase
MLSSEHFYDNLSTSYAKASEQRTNYLRSVDRIASSVIVRTKRGKLLDLGSGDGLRIQKLLLGSPIEISAVENSSEMRNLLYKNPGITKIYEFDIVSLKVPRSSFNYVTALWNVFGHVVDIELALKKAFESLTTGGIFIFDVNNPLNVRAYGIFPVIKNLLFLLIWRRDRKIKLKKNGNETWIYFRSAWYYRKVLKKIGFQNIRLLFIDYVSGENANQFTGQILIICSK